MSKLIILGLAIVGTLFGIMNWAPSLWSSHLTIPQTHVAIPYAFFVLGAVLVMGLKLQKGR